MQPKYIREYMDSCFDANFDDPATRANIAGIIVPKLQNELAAVERILETDGMIGWSNRPTYMSQEDRLATEAIRDSLRNAIKSASEKIAGYKQHDNSTLRARPAG